jgi:hypothetical protein
MLALVTVITLVSLTVMVNFVALFYAAAASHCSRNKGTKEN